MVLCQCLLGEAPDPVSRNRQPLRKSSDRSSKENSSPEASKKHPSPVSPAPAKLALPRSSNYAIYTQPHKIPPRSDQSSVYSAISHASQRSKMTNSPHRELSVKSRAPTPPDAVSSSSAKSSKTEARRPTVPVSRTLGDLLMPSHSTHSSAKGKNVYRSNSSLQVSFTKSHHDLADFYTQHPEYEQDIIEAKDFVVPSRSLTQEDYENCLPPNAYPSASAESARVTVLVERPDSAGKNNCLPQWNSGTFQHVVESRPIPNPPQAFSDAESVNESVKSNTSAKTQTSHVSRHSRASTKSVSPRNESPVFDQDELGDSNPFANEMRRPQSRSSLESNMRKAPDRKSPSRNSLGSVHEQ